MWLIGGLIGILISNMLFGEGWNIIIGFIIGSFIGNMISLYIKEKREIAEQKYKREQAEKNDYYFYMRKIVNRKLKENIKI